MNCLKVDSSTKQACEFLPKCLQDFIINPPSHKDIIFPFFSLPPSLLAYFPSQLVATDGESVRQPVRWVTGGGLTTHTRGPHEEQTYARARKHSTALRKRTRV